jgi:collagen type IV alpha-3-binding protein
MDWETTLSSTRVIELVDEQTLLFYQIHKRVWPAAQRDLCFWSHMRPVSNERDEKQLDWIVCNYSTEHQSAPLKEPMIRALLNVAMTCETFLADSQRDSVCRENLTCQITYVAQVNPGGWLPAAALRAVYKREFPKFLKRFTQYVIEKTSDSPIKFQN